MGKILLITGMPCTFKTTLAREYIKINEDFILASYDNNKEQLWDKFGYDTNAQKESLNMVALSNHYKELESLMSNRHNIVTDYPYYQRHLPKLMELINKYHYEAENIILTAKPDDIYSRYLIAVQKNRHIGHYSSAYHKEKTNNIPSPLSYEEFFESLKGKDYNLKLSKTKTFDTSKMTIEETLKEIVKC